MNVRSRLIFLTLAFTVLVAIGRAVTGSFVFLLNQFWFAAGFFLLLLLSLIDQPHFSKDANIFQNGTTGWISLLLVNNESRDGIWWLFFIWSSYLIVSSFTIMFIRRQELQKEHRIIQTFSRINREIGRPEALFSAFFLWGCVNQFGSHSPHLTPLFLFWAVFMILNLPALAGSIDFFLSPRKKEEKQSMGTILSIVSPRIAEAVLVSDLPTDLVGRIISVQKTKNEPIAQGVLIDDRVVAGRRIGRVAITQMEKTWPSVGDIKNTAVTLYLTSDTSKTVHTGDMGNTSYRRHGLHNLRYEGVLKRFKLTTLFVKIS